MPGHPTHTHSTPHTYMHTGRRTSASKPSMNAFTNSVAFWMADTSAVWEDVWQGHSSEQGTQQADAYSYLHVLRLQVQSDLQVQVLYNWSEDFDPAALQRSESVGRHRNTSKLSHCFSLDTKPSITACNNVAKPLTPDSNGGNKGFLFGSVPSTCIGTCFRFLFLCEVKLSCDSSSTTVSIAGAR